MLQLSAQTQANLVAYYAFNDNCRLNDSTTINPAALDSGTLKCQCGVQGKAVGLYGGSKDFFTLEGRVNNYFGRNDFTVAFYFKAAATTGSMDLFSKREKCDNNQAISIRYTPSSSTIAVELHQDGLNGVVFFKKMKTNICWHHIALVRRGINFKLYLDGVLADEKNALGSFDFTNTAKIAIGNSPCVGITDRRFFGQIDELRIYNRAIDATEVSNLDLYAPDQMPNRDTTIYLGNSVLIGNSNSCGVDTTNKASYSWTPLVGVSDDRIPNPEISPLFTTTYILRTQYTGCQASDSITIKVIDPRNLSCEQLPIPNAFTPNGDGRNDTYGISNPYTLDKLIVFEIVDRIGNIVYKTDNPIEWWDGKYNGIQVNPGVFLYKIKYICTGIEKEQFGTFQLIR